MSFEHDPQCAGDLKLSVLFDDGIVIWLNGQVIWWGNMDMKQDLAYDSYAIRAVTNGDLYKDIWLRGSLFLLRGENVVAVEVHQNAPDSSDLRFDMGLQVEVLPNCQSMTFAAPTSMRSTRIATTKNDDTGTTRRFTTRETATTTSTKAKPTTVSTTIGPLPNTASKTTTNTATGTFGIGKGTEGPSSGGGSLVPVLFIVVLLGGAAAAVAYWAYKRRQRNVRSYVSLHEV